MLHTSPSQSLYHSSLIQAQYGVNKNRMMTQTPDEPYQFYFKSQHFNTELRAMGEKHVWQLASLNDVDTFAQIQDFLNQSESHVVWGGMRFDVSFQSSQEWQAFPAIFFVAPHFVSAQQVNPQNISSTKHVFDSSTGGTYYKSLVEKAISHTRRLNGKVVLAHQEKVTRLNELESVLNHLKARAMRSSVFMLRVNNESAFVGATPEHLFVREGRHLSTEALAGTLPTDANLVFGAKEQEEHRYVQAYIEANLGPLCEGLVSKGTRDMQLSHMKHLHTPYKGVLSPYVNDLMLLAALHPTPAVCGTPRDEAFRFIAEHEGFDRGLYAGVVGYMTAQRSEFVVAIRSALVLKDYAYVYAGAGIVPHSNPSHEWQEVQRKMCQMKECLYA